MAAANSMPSVSTPRQPRSRDDAVGPPLVGGTPALVNLAVVGVHQNGAAMSNNN